MQVEIGCREQFPTLRTLQQWWEVEPEMVAMRVFWRPSAVDERVILIKRPAAGCMLSNIVYDEVRKDETVIEGAFAQDLVLSAVRRSLASHRASSSFQGSYGSM
jgi:hypothetical protein